MTDLRNFYNSILNKYNIKEESNNEQQNSRVQNSSTLNQESTSHQSDETNKNSQSTIEKKLDDGIVSTSAEAVDKVDENDEFNYVEKMRKQFEKKLKNKLKTKTNKAKELNLLDENDEENDIFNFNDTDYSKLPFHYVNEHFDETTQQNKLKNYKFNHNYDTTLPIYSKRDGILKMIESNDVCIIQGNTGCGKTTQVPQMILDQYAKADKYCNIIVTQPRRIAAMLVSNRVCIERGWDWMNGTYCGYQVGLDKNHKSQFTRILYVTTGLLLRKIVADKSEISRFTHIILDEVHERELDADFVLLVIKILRLQGFKAKIILMSATCDANLFSNFFGKTLDDGKIIPTPSINCPFYAYKVNEFYLDDLPEYKPNLHSCNIDTPKFNRELLYIIEKLIDNFDNIEKKNGIETINGIPTERGSVLIFVPGMEEIKCIDEHLRRYYDSRSKNLLIIPLHSDIPFDQQSRAFIKPGVTQRKIIISTSIAESSVTLPDIKYVIDTCLTKSLYRDEMTNYEYLRVEWASKTNLTQRKGRAGRVSDGYCYRLIEKKFYEYLEEYQTPEMLRSSLDKIILKIKKNKKCFVGKPKEVLSLAIQPPKLDSIETTILRLKMAGALSLHQKRVIDSFDGVMTYCGKVMESLPVDTIFAKLILLGHAFGRLRECIILAAACSSKSIFVENFGSFLETYQAKFYWSMGYFCDFICIINAYNMWRIKENRKEFKTSNDRKEWAKNNCLSIHHLQDVYKRKKDIENILAEYHIKCDPEENDEKIITEQILKRHSIDDVTKDFNILKMIIAGAFYPNYFLVKNADELQALRDVNEEDPRKTVFLKGLRSEENIIYTNSIKGLFSAFAQKEHINITFRLNKAFVTFKDSNVKFATNIEYGVYVATCMRLKKLELFVKQVKQNNVEEYNKKIKEILYKENNNRQSTNYQNMSEYQNSQGPSSLIKNKNSYNIRVIEIVDCGYFWAQIDENYHDEQLRIIQQELNKENSKLLPLELNQIENNMLVSALYIDVNDDSVALYRAKVLKKFENNTLSVIFVDYGNRHIVDLNAIFKLDDNLAKYPFNAFKCKLINIKPYKSISQNEKWSSDAKRQFENMINKSESLNIDVYSIVEDVVRVKLCDMKSNYKPVNINQLLIECNVAEHCEESSMSKNNHEHREYIQSRYYAHSFANNTNKPFVDSEKLESLLDKFEFDNSNRVYLEGPYSPLEVKIESIIRISNRLKVKTRISSDSINYVLLDDDPQNQTDRLLVAGDINLNQTSENKYSNIRKTCLLPKIKGLLPITCMLFAPFMEPRVDMKKKIYTGALCGLGFDKNINKPVYAEFDIETTFDTKINNDDFKLIQALRSGINLIIQDDDKAKAWKDDPIKLKTMQELNCKNLAELLNRKRDHMDKNYFNEEYAWNKLSDEKFVGAQDFENILYPTHRLVSFK